jgi:hypothetical protein
MPPEIFSMGFHLNIQAGSQKKEPASLSVLPSALIVVTTVALFAIFILIMMVFV